MRSVADPVFEEANEPFLTHRVERRHDRLPIARTIRIRSSSDYRKRHVFEGRRLFVIRSLTRRGVPEFLVILPDGSRTLIPAAWTDRNGDLDSKPWHQRWPQVQMVPKIFA